MRTLKVAVCGELAAAKQLVARLDRLAEEIMVAETIDAPQPRFLAISGEPDRSTAAQHHLVVTPWPAASVWVDTSVESERDAETLVRDRLVPWLTKWNIGRRAPRAQIAVQTPAMPSWPHEAARLIARLEAALTEVPETAVIRIDHIGSTSVPGLAAKNLVDIQITVAGSQDAQPVAEAATAAGFVHVPGEWFGLDRSGQSHVERVLVDADPGRPVNVNIRSVEVPVAREALLFRDWLRAVPDGRKRYQALKAELAGQQVDTYGDKKEPFISAALAEAEQWATATDWLV